MRFFVAMFYATDKFTSGYINDIKNLASNPRPTVIIACDDSYLTRSSVDVNGDELPDGVYQLVSQLSSNYTDSTVANNL